MPDLSRLGKYRSNRALVVGLTLMLVIVLLAVISPIVLQDRADTLFGRLEGASLDHPLGTDAAGHDVLARTLVAGRLTLLMTVAATAIAVVTGSVIGIAALLLPRRPREVALRAIDALVAFPALLMALAVASIMGPGGISVVVALGAAGAPSFARFTANLAAQVSRRGYVVTARLLGVSPFRTARSHILPNMAEPLMVLTASQFAQALTALSALSFVGLGVQSPHYDYGKLLNDALPFVLAGHPIQMVGPTVMIVLTGATAILIADGLSAVSDPRTKMAARPGASAPRVPSTEKQSPVGDLVRVRNLTVSNGNSERLVEDVSFSIRDGEILGIVGESGSGKSLTAMTLAQLLPEGLTATASEIRIADLDVRSRVERVRMAQTVSLVYQDPGSTFNPVLRMGTQLSAPLRTARGLGAKPAHERIIGSLRDVHISDPERRLAQRPYEFSGGMLQRAMIATALSCSPRLIIADEPTTALDVTVQAKILREFKRVNRVDGTAIVFISHDIEVVKALCDRVLVMNAGRIVEELDSGDLTVERAHHPYTRKLLLANPTLQQQHSRNER
ncbi:dipeptide/oligopeptide/nickel ABC transporter permease/ATP-binding protein [Rhodococcus sp. NPDC003348]